MAKIITENIQTLLSKFKFNMDDDCINEDLTCTICKKLLYDAYQSTCECKYCRKCIVSYINDGNEFCPGGKELCREDLLVLDETVFSNACLNKKVFKVKVRCPNESCQFASTLTQMEDHLRVCSHQPIECPYTKIGCVNERVSRDTVETHLNKYTLAHSQMLMEVVDNLKNEVGGLKEELRANKLEMASLQEECKLKEREIHEKEKKMVQEKRVVEELKRDMAALRGQVECAEENQHRLIKLEKEVMELRGELEIERKESRKMNCEIDTRKNMGIKRGEAKQLRDEIDLLQGDVKRIDDVTERMKKTEVEAADIIDGRVGKLTKTVDSLSKWINKADAVGSLWFKVYGFDELRKEGMTIFSPYLYSHINGYKLRILVNASSSSAVYLDVWSVICKGEYDDALSWPARGLSVSVNIINHRTKEMYKTGTIKYNNQYCSKPIDKDNKPYGCIWRVPFSDLASIPGIIVSDCLLLLVTASPP